MFNLSRFFGGEAAPKGNMETPPLVSVEGKEPFDPELLTFNFTEQEIEKFKKEGKSDEEIELLRKTVLNKLERARFDDHK